jgi:hypothetical protein
LDSHQRTLQGLAGGMQQAQLTKAESAFDKLTPCHSNGCEHSDQQHSTAQQQQQQSSSLLQRTIFAVQIAHTKPFVWSLV